MQIELEEFLEEVKFQMLEWDTLTEEDILGWEKKARKWLNSYRDTKHLISKKRDDIYLRIKNEDVASEHARLYYRAKRDNQFEEYWKTFNLFSC
ncbi:hypothetical protein lbkm_2771 [Lachnospiraceae bacterium KM106-2]|nr:hypothetical protein lbkm_2771 [Lachnospiraceae bacterium KM106-2]